MSLCLVTRTQPGADASVEALQQLGFTAKAVSAAVIVPHHTHIDLSGVQAILMTSAAAARSLHLTPELLAMPLFGVGDMTATTASALGFKNVISAGGDGAALAVLTADRLKPSDGALLHVRGADVAGDVTGMLSACGFETRAQVVYHTQDAPDFGAQLAQLVAGNHGAIIVHSPAGGRRVALALEAAGLAFENWTLFGLSPACLAPLAAHGFKAHFYAPRPDEKALIETILANHAHFGP